MHCMLGWVVTIAVQSEQGACVNGKAKIYDPNRHMCFSFFTTIYVCDDGLVGGVVTWQSEQKVPQGSKVLG